MHLLVHIVYNLGIPIVENPAAFLRVSLFGVFTVWSSSSELYLLLLNQCGTHLNLGWRIIVMSAIDETMPTVSTTDETMLTISTTDDTTLECL